MKLTIDSERLLREMQHLATFTHCEPAGAHAEKAGRETETAVTRVVFTDDDLAARAWLRSLYEEAGLAVRTDAVGNTFARWIGADDTLPAIGTGSHTDAIPHAGMYDGTLGVLGGLEAIRTLQRAGFQPARSVELLMFTSEEPTRFGIGCLGSRLLGSAIDTARADALLDKDATPLHQVREAAGFTGDLHSVALAKDHYAFWVELHIEQGPLLERDNIQIGVVTHIAAPASYRITIEGFGGHAGALLMPDRRDALCAASEIILAVEHGALATGVVDTVATVGTAEIHPGAVNSVPSRVTLMLDVRDTDPLRRESVMQHVRGVCEDLRSRRNVRITEEQINADLPATCDDTILAAIEASCADHALTHQRMVSRAYHDSLFMAQVAPSAMIFIPCRNGVSHRPDEYSTPRQMSDGVAVLASTIARLSAT